MSVKKYPNRNKMIGLIRSGAAKLGLTEDELRALYRGVTRVKGDEATEKDTLTTMSDAEVSRVADEIRRRGFKPLTREDDPQVLKVKSL